MSRENAPDNVLFGGNQGFPHWLHLRLGLHSIFRLQGSRCFSGVSTCHLSVTPSERYGSISVHEKEGQGRFSYSVFPAYSPASFLLQLSPVQFEMLRQKHQNDLN